MKRWHEDYYKVTLREWKEHRRSHVESNKNSGWRYDRTLKQSVFAEGRDPYEVDCDCDEQKGRFRKKDAWDCGNTRCGICHGDKFPKRTKHDQELKSELSFKEQLRDFYEGDVD